MGAPPILNAVHVRSLSDRVRYRWSVAFRTLAAVVGGYIVTSLFNIAVSLSIGTLGVDVPQALLATTIMSFLLYAAIIMAVFHARSPTRAWLWLAGATALLGILARLHWQGVGP